MTTTPDPKTVREIAREAIERAARRRDYIGSAITDHDVMGEILASGDRSAWGRWNEAVRAEMKTATVTVSWPDEQPQDNPCPRCKYGTERHRDNCKHAEAEQPQDDGDVRAVAALREELALVSDQAEHAVDLLARTIGSTPCRLDSWGDCDAHGFQGIETGEQCPHALARAFLAGAGRSIAALDARDAKTGEQR